MTRGMSTGGVLGHRCSSGHPAMHPWHRRVTEGRSRRLGPCRVPGCACEHPEVLPGVEVIPAYSSTTGDRLDYVVEPGVSADGMDSHGCQACRALWESLPHPAVDEQVDLFGGGA